MSLLKELVAGLKGWAIMELSGWLVVLIAAVVFVVTLIAGSALFGDAAGLAIGISSALLVAFVVGPRLRNRFGDGQQ
ncbi:MULTISPECIES: hypothetical protein [unclassified Halorubrum]|uniref:hypothetical protein n=1 Tax=unclassified Halorubrum TaxID=2642239 RepID=UPI000B98C716|nr:MULTISPECIES: hypothetical protein [unclassified Halorubrum]OYR45610.1 hypothetical protein DJ81_04345 [Halorubrum sp. Hd13]OYR50107.1 hypothetical protein DJ74_07090 [Halorubrum sp. Ea8]